MKKLNRNLFVFSLVFVVAFGFFAVQVLAALSFDTAVQNGVVAGRHAIAQLDANHAAAFYYDAAGGELDTSVRIVNNANPTTFGTEYDVKTDVQYTELAITALTSTTFVIAYSDPDNSNMGYARVCTTNGSDTITGCTALGEQFYNNTVAYTAIDALDRTADDISDNRYRFVISYSGAQAVGDPDVMAVVGEYDADTGAIAFGSTNQVDADDPTAITGVTALDSEYFVVAYQDSGSINIGRAKIGNINISGVEELELDGFGTQENYVASGSVGDVDIEALSSTSVIIAYEFTTSTTGYAIVCDVTSPPSTTLDCDTTTADNKLFNTTTTGGTDYVSLAVLDSTHVVVAYREDVADGKAQLLTITGTTIDVTLGNEATFYDTAAFLQSVAAAPFDGSTFMISYGEDDPTDYWFISGSESTLEGEVVPEFSSKFAAIMIGASALGLFGLIVMLRGKKKKKK